MLNQQKIEEKNLSEGNFEVGDPVEKNPENINNNEEQIKNQKKYRPKRYKIQEVIKPNQVILVQVLKDERGFKGAALSTFILSLIHISEPTRLLSISYAVFCLKKKKKKKKNKKKKKK